MVFHTYVVNNLVNKGVCTLISTAQQQDINGQIALARIRNEIATEQTHEGHDIIIQRWSGTHKVRVCTTCECSVGPLIESKAKVKDDPIDRLTMTRAKESRYKAVPAKV